MNVKTLLVILALMLPVIARAKAPGAPITGQGTCDVTFDASGHVAKIAILQSTGSAILDANTLDFARKHWTGRPNTRVKVPIYYKLGQPTPASPAAVRTPQPPYPYQARAGHITGTGQVRVVFDASGSVSKAEMAKSTGSGILDGNSVNWARANWHGRPNTTITVPVAYRIQ